MFLLPYLSTECQDRQVPWETPGLGHPTQSEQAEKLPSAPWPRHQDPQAGEAEGDHLHRFLAP